METATFVLIAVAAIIAALLAGFHYLYKTKEKNQTLYWLFSFRFLSLFFIFILLINPSIKTTTTQQIKPHLLVAVDNSASIRFHNSENEIKKVVNQLKTAKSLQQKFNISFYSFGKDLTVLDTLSFSEKQTNLAAPLQYFSKQYQNTIAPTVLISDGNQTVGNNIAYQHYKNPVFSYIVGDTTLYEDIYIQQINSNKTTFKHNKFPVEILINYTGNKAISKQLKVYHHGKVVFSKQVSFSEKDNAKTISFFLTATETGKLFYKAKIESLENEKNTLNNLVNFSIESIENTSKILILTAVVHPDLGMLKKAIESSKQHRVIIKNIDNLEKIDSNYKLIILYQPTNRFKRIWEQINEKKQNYFVITGLSTQWNFLNTIQPYFYKDAISSSEDYTPELNKNYLNFSVKNIDFTAFPPLTDYFGEITFKTPYNTLLYQKIGNITTKNPLLATFEEGDFKGGVLFGENSWRWRMADFSSHKSFENFDNFMANLIQYLSLSKNNSQLTVSNNAFYYANETVRFTAIYVDKNLNFDDRATLYLNIRNTANSFSTKIPFSVSNTKYIAEISDLEEGTYTYSVSVENNKNQRVSGVFKVLPFQIEQQNTGANKQLLTFISEKTHGNSYFNNQVNRLINDLNSDTRFKTLQKTITSKKPLISLKWLLILILLLLSAEWFTRKYVGKI
ncbi:VWA domain-containing protein [Lutibacter sp.]